MAIASSAARAAHNPGVIRARGLSRSYGGRPAVQDVDLRVEAGEVVGFLGPNGAGKTTTLRMLVGLLCPDEGSVGVARPVGDLPEGFGAYDALPVRSYLRFIGR